MRIAFVTGEYPPMQGGVGAFTREVARAAARARSEVLVFTRSQTGDSGEPGIEVFPRVNGAWGWRTVSLIARWVEQQRPDVVNIQFQTAAYNMHPSIHWLPSQLSRTPVVVTFHDLRVPYLFPKAGRVRTWVVRKLAKDANAVIATDRADEVVLRDDWQIPSVRWIPIGSNISTTPPKEFDRASWRSRWAIGERDLLISYFGFLNESKGGMTLVCALARLIQEGVPAHLIMIGGRAGASDPTNFEYGQRVDSLICSHQLQDRVHWTGFVDDTEVTASFLASDVTALPYRDGVSLRRGTLMAALAHGRAIVTTHPTTHAPELDGALLTVPADDSDALADGIKTLWADPACRAKYEEAAVAAASHFTWDEIARRTVDFFEEILAL